MALPLTHSHPPLPSLGTAHTLFKLLKRILIAAEHQTVWKNAKSTSLIKDEIGQGTMRPQCYLTLGSIAPYFCACSLRSNDDGKAH